MTFKPTPAQQAIIDCIEGEPQTSVRVKARAGAAKTSTIELAAQKIGPQFSPIAVAFNKKIAEELTRRLPSHFTCATLNGVGHRAWSNRLSKRLLVDADKMMKLAKTLDLPRGEDDGDLFIEMLTLARAAKMVGLIPSTTQEMFRRNSIVPDRDTTWDELAFAKGLVSYHDEAIFFARQLLQKSIDRAWQGEIDFDDQIYMSTLFGGQYPRHHTVIVDEAQDLSPLNHIQIIKMTGTRAIIVGDDAQAIYGFRGADTDSINNLVAGLQDAGIVKWKELPLSKSFRVPHAISRRQLDHVPDFGSMDFLPEGKIEEWPKPDADGVFGPNASWSLDAIPQHGAVLCRNNAPLMALAFAMIKQKRPVKILGRDIGANIANLLLKITSKTVSIPIEKCWPMLEDWRAREAAKAGDSETKLDILQDRYDALHVLLDAGGKKDNLESAAFIKELFSDKADDHKTTFSSMHRAKGLEWDWVMILDPHRIPSIQAVRADRRGDPGPLIQEKNLGYVGETRTKHTLVLAKLEDCIEVGE